jgi:hypothetical protein
LRTERGELGGVSSPKSSWRELGRGGEGIAIADPEEAGRPMKEAAADPPGRGEAADERAVEKESAMTAPQGGRGEEIREEAR